MAVYIVETRNTTTTRENSVVERERELSGKSSFAAPGVKRLLAAARFMYIYTFTAR